MLKFVSEKKKPQTFHRWSNGNNIAVHQTCAEGLCFPILGAFLRAAAGDWISTPTYEQEKQSCTRKKPHSITKK